MIVIKARYYTTRLSYIKLFQISEDWVRPCNIINIPLSKSEKIVVKVKMYYLVRDQNKQELCILFVLCVIYEYWASNIINNVLVSQTGLKIRQD